VPESARLISERIFVRNFVIPVRIGAFDHERSGPQNVRFDVAVDVERGRGEPTGMGEVVSYDIISDGIRAIAAEGHIDLVETFAERIAALVLREPRAWRASVTVTKLEVIPGEVGVELVMERDNAQPS
jgi:(5-formylfuran-3-yl)methyl phosphate synthase